MSERGKEGYFEGYSRVINSTWSLGGIAPQEPPQLQYALAQMLHYHRSPLERLTGSPTEHKSHDRKHSLKLSSPNDPYDRYDYDGYSDQKSNYSELLGPETLLEFEPDGFAMVTGFELCEPVYPFVSRANAVRVVNGMQEGVRVGIVFGSFGDWDTVGGVL